MRTIFAIGRLNREGARIVVAERRQVSRAGRATPAHQAKAQAPRVRRLPSRGDFRPPTSAPGTIH